MPKLHEMPKDVRYLLCGTCSDFTREVATVRVRYSGDAFWRYRCDFCMREGGGPYAVTERLESPGVDKGGGS